MQAVVCKQAAFHVACVQHMISRTATRMLALKKKRFDLEPERQAEKGRAGGAVYCCCWVCCSRDLDPGRRSVCHRGGLSGEYTLRALSGL